MPAFRALYVKSGWDEKLEGNKGDDYSFYFIYFLQAEGELQKMDEAVTMERDGVGQRGRRRRERRKRGNIGNEGSASDLSSAYYNVPSGVPRTPITTINHRLCKMLLLHSIPKELPGQDAYRRCSVANWY